MLSSAVVGGMHQTTLKDNPNTTYWRLYGPARGTLGGVRRFSASWVSGGATVVV